MARTSAKQKVILIVSGLLCAVLLLELGLRAAGFIYLSLQDLRSAPVFKNTDSCKILCLGESTTALGGKSSYPCQLEDILNNKNTGIEFSVINKGIVGIRTPGIVLNLERALDKYEPDIVVAMMGVNDYGDIIPYSPEDNKGKLGKFLSSMRIHKLAKLLWQHIKEKKKWLIDSSTNDYARCIELAEHYGNIGRPDEAERMFRKAIKVNPNDETAYIQMGFYYNDLPKYKEARKMLEAALNINPRNIDAYIGLAELYSFQKQYNKAEKIYNKASGICPDSRKLYFELGCHYRRQGAVLKAIEAYSKALDMSPVGAEGSFNSCQAVLGNDEVYLKLGLSYKDMKMYDKAQEMLEKCLEVNPQHQRAYVALGQCYHEQGSGEKIEPLFHKMKEAYPGDNRVYNFLSQFYRQRPDLQASQKCLQEANRLKSGSYNDTTLSSYQSLKNKVLSRNIALVCVQYPLCDIETLKNIVGPQAGIIFVDNREAFQKALNNEGYNEYFIDRFAVDFGHCTPKGNRLLAENIADSVLKMNNR